MLIRFFLASALVAFAFAINEYLPSLKGMQGISITCDNKDKLDLIRKYDGQKGFNFVKITKLPSENVQVLVTADQVSDFKNQLKSNGIDYKVNIEDAQKLVDKESKEQNLAQKKKPRSFSRPFINFDFSYFPRQAIISEYMVEMSRNYKDVALFSIGRSFEGREMYGLKISSDVKNSVKPAILIEAGIHAREWIAPVTALFAISELVKENNKYLYKNVDWYIIPSMNPDGYELTHTKHRYWRKTVSNYTNSECIGADPNRNFDFKWMEGGASSDPCNELFAGNKPFSEAESRNLRDFVLSKKGTIKIFISLHSNGQILGFPWAYTKEVHANYTLFKSLGEKAAKALSAFRGTTYVVESIARILYESSGSTIDWAMAHGGADLSYVFELPGYYFHVQPNEIKPIGSEIFEAFKVFGKYLEETYIH